MAADVEQNVEITLVELSPSTIRSMEGALDIGDLYSANSSLNNSGDGSLQPALVESERLVSIIVPTIFAVIVLLGLLGNLLVILIILSDKHMRNTTNILILSLAVADLLFIIFCVPFTAAAYALPVWPFGSVWCKVVQYMIYVCAYASVYTLVLMSLDRYLAVVHAIRSMRIRTERNTWLVVAVIWVIITLGHIPLLVQNDILQYLHFGEKRMTCTNVLHVNDPHTGKIFFMSFLTFGYALPLGVVCLLYGFMLKRLLYGVVPGGNQSQESIRAKKRVTRMVIFVVITFALCWVPIQIILVLQKYDSYPASMASVGIHIASNCLAYMNSCVNPFLYALMSENFRRSFWKVLCCRPPSTRRMDYERTNIRYTDKESKSTNLSRSVNHV